MADRPLHQLQSRCRPLRIHALVALEAARAAGDWQTMAYWQPLADSPTVAEQAEADDVCRGVLAVAVDCGLDYPALLRDTAAMGGQLSMAAFHHGQPAGD